MTGDVQHLLQRSLLGEAVDLTEDVAVFVWNEERRYVAVNECACKLVGLGRDELLGMPVGELTDDRASALAQAQASRLSSGTLSFTRPDGEAVELDWLTTHTRVAGLQYMVSICRRVG